MKKAIVNQDKCVACGCCMATCRIGAVTVPNGVSAIIDTKKCVGCGLCAKACPASVIRVEEVHSHE